MEEQRPNPGDYLSSRAGGARSVELGRATLDRDWICRGAGRTSRHKEKPARKISRNQANQGQRGAEFCRIVKWSRWEEKARKVDWGPMRMLLD